MTDGFRFAGKGIDAGQPFMNSHGRKPVETKSLPALSSVLSSPVGATDPIRRPYGASQGKGEGACAAGFHGLAPVAR